jgi:hypothetical protein
MNIYGLGSTTDLGKRVFYFSCKNYSSKVYTSFAKVVVLVTHSTEKLVLHFFGFLYNFIWILQVTGSKGENLKILFLPKSLESVEPSHNNPWVLHSGPKKIPIFTSLPFRRREDSPSAIAARTWTKNGSGLSKCSPEVDWWHRWGRSDLWRWPAARQ